MISLSHALILGFIEGLTEFLPISSTGHLIIANHFLGNDLTSQLVQTFEISIQLGAILAVLGTYWKELWQWPTIRLLLYGFVPTAIIGLLAKEIIGDLLALPILVASTLIIGGIGIIGAEIYIKKRSNFFEEKTEKNNIASNPNIGEISSASNQPIATSVSKKQAIFLGIWQSLALIPGMSRSGSMIIGGLLMNIKREILVKYTFLIAVPTMSAATLLSLKDSIGLFSKDSATVLVVGFFTAFVTAFFAIRFFIPYIRKHTFTWFGVYRIVVGVILLFILL